MSPKQAQSCQVRRLMMMMTIAALKVCTADSSRACSSSVTSLYFLPCRILVLIPESLINLRSFCREAEKEKGLLEKRLQRLEEARAAESAQLGAELQKQREAVAQELNAKDNKINDLHEELGATQALLTEKEHALQEVRHLLATGPSAFPHVKQGAFRSSAGMAITRNGRSSTKPLPKS